jgi:hypothetical protein
VIFASGHGAVVVDDGWFEHALPGELFGVPVQLVSPTELIWSKAFIQARDRYDGADIVQVILKQHDRIDWTRLLAHMELHWEVLLAHLVNFRWTYPSERRCVPDWLMDELIDRLRRQRALPSPQARVCRGRIVSQADYEIAVKEWGFLDISDQAQ